MPRRGIAVQIDKFDVADLGNALRLDGVGVVQLPTDTNLTNTTKVTGLWGEIEVPARGMKAAQQATYNIPQIYGPLVSRIMTGKCYTFTIRGSMTVVDKDTKENVDVPVRYDITGPFSQKNPGKIEQAGTGDGDMIQQVWAFAWWIDGDEVRAWDVIKGIDRVGGIDQNADILRNIMM